ncbi:VOC family protein [Calidifontibacter sp. DB0510]|uniref:VOC family protein n=1 Tax=Metallococcus carri TaxID=1656884 RepID=A0A967B7X7_9MICO|nr:VOC family protein [Metallococcus carri]NHN57237.1 VOC family protein [Metallococcus carri]NOP37960.1 VOC family protein [Calidifontibacter sp. DB2511S]
MRVDHVVYAAESDGVELTAKRLGEQLGVEPGDSGVHPRFGTRNVVIPLAEHRFVEVVEVLDHPASDKAAFGQAVRARSAAGGGWLGWVVEVDDMAGAERALGRPAAPGNRHRPDGTELTWRQLGVKGLMADPQVPFFIEWGDGEPHPSQIGQSTAKLRGMAIAGSPDRVREWLGLTGEPGVDRDEWEPDIEFTFAAPHGTPGVLSVSFETPSGVVTI